jgi:hypothetical protein
MEVSVRKVECQLGYQLEALSIIPLSKTFAIYKLHVYRDMLEIVGDMWSACGVYVECMWSVYVTHCIWFTYVVHMTHYL